MIKIITIATVLIIFNLSIVSAVQYDNAGEYRECMSLCGSAHSYYCALVTDCAQGNYENQVRQMSDLNCVAFAQFLNTASDSQEFAKHNLTVREDCLSATVAEANNTALIDYNQCNQDCIDNTAALLCTRAATTVGEYDTCVNKCDYANEYNCAMSYQCYNEHLKQLKCEKTTLECEEFKTFTEEDWSTSFTKEKISKQKSCLTSCVDEDTDPDVLVTWDTCIQSCIDLSCECCDEEQPEEEAEEEESEEEEFEQDINTMGEFRDCKTECQGLYQVPCLNDNDCFSQHAKQLSCNALQSGCTAFIAYDDGSSDSSSITETAKANEVDCFTTCEPKIAPVLETLKHLPEWNTCDQKCIYKVNSTDTQENNDKKDDNDGDGGDGGGDDGGSASILTLGSMTVLGLFATLCL